MPLAGSVIDLTLDSPVSPVPIAEQTGTKQSVVFLYDSIDISSPIKQARLLKIARFDANLNS